jgi:hypothetical protein
MKNLRYICVQPRILYYAWQVEVMINNFIKHGINPNNIDILIAWNPYDQTSSQENIDAWNKLSSNYNYVRFFFYEDTRIKPIHYISSIRPNILKQHFLAYPELSDEAIFYHDCDIAFTKNPNWDKFLNDNIWYLSDTNSYINYDYIISKGQDVYDKMCSIIGIDPIIPKLMNSNSGGAQYIIKNLDSSFWEKVERDSEKLFYEITELNNEKIVSNRHTVNPNEPSNSIYHPLQIWCADMWAVLWNAWLRGNETKIVPELDFSWGTDSIDRWDATTIFHNAGVTCSCGGQFYKANYINDLPYNKSLRISNKYCSYNYYQEILETEKKSPLL